MDTRVLVIHSVRERADELTRLLSGHGFVTAPPVDPASALEALRTCRPSLVVGNLDLSSTAGLDLCRRMRESTDAPIIVLNDDPSRPAEAEALDSGADDYILWPSLTETLLARIRSALRRAGATRAASVVSVGPFHIDFDDRRVRVRGQAVRLTPKEFDLFTFMARHPNRVLPHRTLLGAVWGVNSEEQSEYLRVFVGQLRKKLEADPANPCHLLTEPWVGYRFNPEGARP